MYLLHWAFLRYSRRQPSLRSRTPRFLSEQIDLLKLVVRKFRGTNSPEHAANAET